MEFKVEDKYYRTEKMDCFKQFHVLRKAGPLYPSVVGALRVKDQDLMLAAGYIAAAFARLSDDEANFIMTSCLGTCSMKQGSVWSPVVNSSGSLMFNDITLPELLEVVWKVLEYNFGPFIQGLLLKASAMEAQAQPS